MSTKARPASLASAGRDFTDAEDLLVDRVSAHGGAWTMVEAYRADDWYEGDLFVCRTAEYDDVEHYLVMVGGYDSTIALTGAGVD